VLRRYTADTYDYFGVGKTPTLDASIQPPVLTPILDRRCMCSPPGSACKSPLCLQAASQFQRLVLSRRLCMCSAALGYSNTCSAFEHPSLSSTLPSLSSRSCSLVSFVIALNPELCILNPTPYTLNP
jgi:hypothetical protein